MTRRDVLRTLPAIALGKAGMAQSRKPNLVILYADDMGWNDVAFNGRKEWNTPNLDRLASQGTQFSRWYTAMPLCAPSRACLLTGKYTIHHTVRTNSSDLPKSEVTLAEALKPLGYRTALCGKWHRGKLPDGSFTHPLEQGFDRTYGYLDAIHAWEHFPKEFYRGREKEPVKGYSSDLLVDEAIKFIQEDKTRPFFLYAAFIEPHFYIESPEENLAKFKGKFPENDPAKPYNAHYAGMIERLDASIGRLMKAIDDAGLGENTLIVFSSDNGATFEVRTEGAPYFHDSNRPFRGQKRSLEEGGIRVPGLVRWTGKVPAGRKSNEVMHMTDVMPSFLAAAGGTPQPAWKVDGRNMLDVWMGKSPAPARTLFWEFQTEGIDQYAAMRGDWKLLVMGKNRYLYNIAVDREERKTLHSAKPDLVKQLQGELDAWKATEVKP